MRLGRIHSVVFILTLVCSLATSHALAQAPYFQYKTIKIIRGGEPGGTGDLQARALLPSLRKHIPGNPTIIIENMPGAAGRKAVNHIYATAKARIVRFFVSGLFERPEDVRDRETRRAIHRCGRRRPGRRTYSRPRRISIRHRQTDLSRLDRKRRSLRLRQSQGTRL